MQGLDEAEKKRLRRNLRSQKIFKWNFGNVDSVVMRLLLVEAYSNFFSIFNF